MTNDGCKRCAVSTKVGTLLCPPSPRMMPCFCGTPWSCQLTTWTGSLFLHSTGGWRFKHCASFNQYQPFNENKHALRNFSSLMYGHYFLESQFPCSIFHSDVIDVNVLTSNIEDQDCSRDLPALSIWKLDSIQAKNSHVILSISWSLVCRYKFLSDILGMYFVASPKVSGI